MSREIKKRTALVTGAGQGIGRAIALALAEKGISVAVNDLNQERAEAVCAEIRQLGVDALPLVGDVSSFDSVSTMLSELFDRWGHLTILVNNAGIVQTSGILDITQDQWDRVMAVNVRSVFLCSQGVFPKMQELGYGKIINIASVAGKQGGGLLGNSCYAASKGATIALTKGLAREGGPFGIRVNAVTPALTDTEMTAQLAPDKRAAIIKMIPLGRPGQPTDIAKAVCFLASEDSDFITGEIMDVDGGFMRD